MKKTSIRMSLFALALVAAMVTSCNKKTSDTTTTETTQTDTVAPAPEMNTTSATTAKDTSASLPDTISTKLPGTTKTAEAVAMLKSNLKANKHGSVIIGDLPKAKRKCVTVTYSDGSSGTICASKTAIDEIKADCAKNKDCDVKDVQP